MRDMPGREGGRLGREDLLDLVRHRHDVGVARLHDLHADGALPVSSGSSPSPRDSRAPPRRARGGARSRPSAGARGRRRSRRRRMNSPTTRRVRSRPSWRRRPGGHVEVARLEDADQGLQARSRRNRARSCPGRSSSSRLGAPEEADLAHPVHVLDRLLEGLGAGAELLVGDGVARERLSTRMGRAPRLYLRTMGRVESAGSLSTMASMAFCTSITAVSGSVSIVNCEDRRGRSPRPRSSGWS